MCPLDSLARLLPWEVCTASMCFTASEDSLRAGSAGGASCFTGACGVCPDHGNDALSSLPEASAAVWADVPGRPVDQGRFGGWVGVGIGLGV
ncbi:MAG: hypothetical protein CVT65_13585 [Actinobacteria bacterium HGW-Actinobacteria-5]|nr:MAG: hypothetical protein CVT65_13585 [Actinobacteria bacterium HGW-Actinobacteria-5]